MYTYIMKRTQIYLTSDEARAIAEAAQKSGRTQSHLIRDAIDKIKDAYKTTNIGRSNAAYGYVRIR
jgi:hypothetical protein